MTSNLLCLFILLWITVAFSQDIVDQIQLIRSQVTALGPPPNEHLLQPSQQYLENERPWVNIVGDKPILVEEFWGRWDEFGNYIGVYFESLACASLAHVHFMLANTEWPTGNYAVRAQGSDRAPFQDFLDLLPDVVLSDSPLPANRSIIAASYAEHCKCKVFCWENEDAALLQRLPLVNLFSKRIENIIYGEASCSRCQHDGSL